METHICQHCHQEKPITEFSKRANGDHRCKVCSNAFSRRSYYRNRERNIQKAAERARKKYQINKMNIYAYKEQHGCKYCPEKDPVCLDFHHPDKNKEYEIGNRHMSHKWEKLLLEILKCEVVCSNCHRKLHAREGRNGRPKGTRCLTTEDALQQHDEELLRLKNL